MTTTAPAEASLDASARDLAAAVRKEATRSGLRDPNLLTRRLYAELRHLARGHRRRWNGNLTMNTTAIVHEAYLRVAPKTYESELHFLRVSSRAMRHVLVNYARDRAALKRGGGGYDVSLDDAPEHALLSAAEADGLLGLDGALARLARFDPRAARVVELRFFGGLRVDEAAGVLGVSPSSVARDWRRTRLWLFRELGPDVALPSLERG